VTARLAVLLPGRFFILTRWIGLVKVGVGVKEEVDGDDEDVSSPRAARGSLVAETRGGGSPVFC
jgi:hypothetical protein